MYSRAARAGPSRIGASLLRRGRAGLAFAFGDLGEGFQLLRREVHFEGVGRAGLHALLAADAVIFDDDPARRRRSSESRSLGQALWQRAPQTMHLPGLTWATPTSRIVSSILQYGFFCVMATRTPLQEDVS